MSEFEDLIVGDRMAVDREFSSRVAESEFSSQQWGLVMTAVDFHVEHASDPDRARLVADTSNVEQIVPELESIEQSMGAMGPAGAGPTSNAGESDGGLLGSVKDALGFGGDDGGDDAESIVREADRLTDEYATLLQDRLENEGKWEQVRAAASDGHEDA